MGEFVFKTFNIVKKTFFLLFTTTTLFAQNISHTNFWSKISIGHPLTNKINAEAEFQKRWQKDSNENSNCIPDKKMND